MKEEGWVWPPQRPRRGWTGMNWERWTELARQHPHKNTQNPKNQPGAPELSLIPSRNPSKPHKFHKIPSKSPKSQKIPSKYRKSNKIPLKSPQILAFPALPAAHIMTPAAATRRQ